MAEILPLDSVHSKPGMHSISTSLPLNQSDIHSLSSASYTSHSLSAVCEHPVAAAAEDDAIHITHLPSQPQLACADATSTPTQLNASPNLILSTSLAKLVVYLESCIPQGPHLPPSFGTLMATFHRYLTSINHAESRLARSKIISSIETRFGIPAAVSTFLMAIAGSIAGQKILAKYPHQVATCVGVIYPAWCSIRAIEHPREDDDERWLTYWSVYGVLTLFDHMATYIQKKLRIYYIPKIVLMIWLAKYNGSLVVYRKLLRPFMFSIQKVLVQRRWIETPYNVTQEPQPYILKD